MLDCRDCDKTFEYTAKSQQWIERKGFSEPKRCGSCKANKRKYHDNIKKAFANNCVGSVPEGAVVCSWCGNPCHSEKDCQWKKQATCKTCGKVGRPSSTGFASGLRTNNVSMGCACASTSQVNQTAKLRTATFYDSDEW